MFVFERLRCQLNVLRSIRSMIANGIPFPLKWRRGYRTLRLELAALSGDERTVSVFSRTCLHPSVPYISGQTWHCVLALYEVDSYEYSYSISSRRVSLARSFFLYTFVPIIRNLFFFFFFLSAQAVKHRFRSAKKKVIIWRGLDLCDRRFDR